MSRIQITNEYESKELSAQIILGAGITDDTENNRIDSCVFTTGSGVCVGDILSTFGCAVARILDNIVGHDKEKLDDATGIFLTGLRGELRAIDNEGENNDD